MKSTETANISKFQLLLISYFNFTLIYTQNYHAKIKWAPQSDNLGKKGKILRKLVVVINKKTEKKKKEYLKRNLIAFHWLSIKKILENQLKAHQNY